MPEPSLSRRWWAWCSLRSSACLSCERAEGSTGCVPQDLPSGSAASARFLLAPRSLEGQPARSEAPAHSSMCGATLIIPLVMITDLGRLTWTHCGKVGCQVRASGATGLCTQPTGTVPADVCMNGGICRSGQRTYMEGMC